MGSSRSIYLSKLRHSLPWLVRYPVSRAGSFFRTNSPAQKHIIFVIANHFEPGWRPVGIHNDDVQNRRVDEHYALARKIGDSIRDSDGTKFRHTHFYPAEQYNRQILNKLSQMQSEGLGEVEVHLHHGVDEPDTPENLKRALIEFRDVLADEHKCLSRLDGVGQPMYAFVHGNLALANSRGGDYCGVDNEMHILRETGCYADMTLPTAPDQSQVPVMNKIYEFGRPISEKIPHRVGRNVKSLGQRPRLPIIFTGPLVFDWTGWRKRFFIPRIDTGALTGNQRMDLRRFERWTSANITVEGQPEWVFIKLYCHSFVDEDQSASIGELASRFFSDVVENGEKTGDYRVYFASAREACNMVWAAMEGSKGGPGDFRDYRLRAIIKERSDKNLAARSGLNL